MKKLLFLAMVLGLFMVGTARAEGAWVLWEKYQVSESKVPNARYQEIVFTEWRIIEAFENKKSCSDDLEQHINEYVKAGWTVPESNRHRVFRPSPYLPETTSWIRELICLPESVDPRK
jgi:hypothetical protein